MKRWLGLVSSLFLFGCSSSSDPVSQATADDAGEPSPESTSDSGSPGTPSLAGDAGSGGSVTPSDAATPPSDGGAPSPGPLDAGASGVFAGAGAYVQTLGPSARNPKHPGSNPAGTPCLTCHDGQKGVVAFLFGGTVWKDANATIPAPATEVRVLGANGSGTSAYSDADGNFFYAASAQALSISAPAHAGIRNATSTSTMNNLINDANCNQCHRSGGEPRLVLP